jgi:hypothetical protein
LDRSGAGGASPIWDRALNGSRRWRERATTSGKNRLRFLLLRLQADPVAVAMGETSEAVKFRFVEPVVATRQFVDRLGFHRLERRRLARWLFCRT